ncbi:probable kinetochore protein NUF2 isoform X3 [Sorghum bicolor]|uniref:probable kinetochore protein NUF2 isoform X3 n=1 Tax=Sorghum bicolor TaxID=4558 RepID=UPI000B423F0E|nr:probable kinetochore protein NUF2 isoform X3 [Sorghum bicolor]|eukprot:XP_021305074.1 probable kinetochore protein NUF2 isoform X3 [Sorghum bicolor]
MAAPASASGGDTPKQLLSIIRDFAYEKSHGERRVSDLRRRLADARAASDAAAAELDAAKRAREAAEQDLRGSQVQAAIAADSILALEATISHLQEEISKAGTHLDALKSKGDNEREEFISNMYEMNAKIRQFQQMASLELAEPNHCELPSTEGEHVRDKSKTVDSEGISKELADKVSNIESEVQLLEEEYKKDLLDHDKVRQELADVQAKRALMEAVMGETKQLQELGEYPETHRSCSVGTHAPVAESTTCLGRRRPRTRGGVR